MHTKQILNIRTLTPAFEGSNPSSSAPFLLIEPGFFNKSRFYCFVPESNVYDFVHDLFRGVDLSTVGYMTWPLNRSFNVSAILPFAGFQHNPLI